MANKMLNPVRIEFCKQIKLERMNHHQNPACDSGLNKKSRAKELLRTEIRLLKGSFKLILVRTGSHQRVLSRSLALLDLDLKALTLAAV